jgi:hypothetical protein
MKKRNTRLKKNRIITFKIYPESVHSFYYVVTVCANFPEMYDEAEKIRKKFGAMKLKRDYNAIVIPYRVKPKGKKYFNKLLGEVIFNQQRLESEIVSHEMAHVVFDWAKVVKLDFQPKDNPNHEKYHLVSDNEERYCYALGRLVAQVTDSFWSSGLYNYQKTGDQNKTGGMK